MEGRETTDECVAAEGKESKPSSTAEVGSMRANTTRVNIRCDQRVLPAFTYFVYLCCCLPKLERTFRPQKTTIKGPESSWGAWEMLAAP